jgi:hypothetical protein
MSFDVYIDFKHDPLIPRKGKKGLVTFSKCHKLF